MRKGNIQMTTDIQTDSAKAVGSGDLLGIGFNLQTNINK